MTIPFHYVTRRKMTIKGMVISAMFFGCRVSGEKNGIFDERLKLVSASLTSSCLRETGMGQIAPYRSRVID